MRIKRGLILLPGLFMFLLVGTGGCGFASAAQSPAGSTPVGTPDSVRIAIDMPVLTVLTLKASVLRQQLYKMIYTLPQMPEEIACTMELGPHYTLTFLQGDKTLGTALAMRDGCRPVSVAGEKHDRKATAEFWILLDKAIYQATPPARPDELALMHVPLANQQPQTAQIATTSTIQRFYNRILALPLFPFDSGYPSGSPDYRLVFHAGKQSVSSEIYLKSSIISLKGDYQTRSGRYKMNDQFKRLFTGMLAGVTFATAHPDQLSLSLNGGNKNIERTIPDEALVQKLYTKISTLPLAKSQQFPDCVGEDKVKGKGTWYTLHFTQWSLPILQMGAYSGTNNCTLLSSDGNNPYLQDDQELWSLIHRASNQ